jgi:catalase
LTRRSRKRFEFDVLDATKWIPEEQVPIRCVGRLVLDRCVDNFFAETEQVAFCTQNIIPGIDFSNDPQQQGRGFSYLDTQLKRLGGPNFTQLPINAPKCPVHVLQQDGQWPSAPAPARELRAEFVGSRAGRSTRGSPGSASARCR